MRRMASRSFGDHESWPRAARRNCSLPSGLPASALSNVWPCVEYAAAIPAPQFEDKGPLKAALILARLGEPSLSIQPPVSSASPRASAPGRRVYVATTPALAFFP